MSKPTYRNGVATMPVRDLYPGVRCDLEGDEIADPYYNEGESVKNPAFEFEFQTVERVSTESPGVILVDFVSGFACAFPDEHEIEVDPEQEINW